MKRLICMLLAGMTLPMLPSCGLLDIQPRQELREDVMFGSESGFKQALIGVYIRLASEKLYGGHVTYYMPDLLAQTWKLGTFASETDRSGALLKWDFTHSEVEKMISGIWQQYYSAIAELNNLLDHIDAKKSLFYNGNYELIKGEALGLRAFLHLDLLRLFGPMPRGASGSADAIPYVEVFTKNPADYQSLTYADVKSRIIRDLDEAERLLADDPILRSTIDLNGYSSDDELADQWQDARQTRFNIYAVQAAKARYYDWTGDSENAVKYAEAVIDAQKFQLVNSASFDNTAFRDRLTLTFIPEHIFGMHNPRFSEIVRPYFAAGNMILTQDKEAIDALYASDVDIRNIKDRFWKDIYDSGYGYGFHFLKYTGSDQMPTANRIPVIRIPEMYFIALENLPHGDPRIEQYLVALRDARRLDDQFVETSLKDRTALLSNVEREYRREMMGEGLLFFQYKKNNVRHYQWPAPAGFSIPETSDYRIPKPKGQLSFEDL